MAIRPFLAMTGAEMRNNHNLPPKIAWMACHFSPYGMGLSNLPPFLPPGSLLILNDRTPIRGHDPELIIHQLKSCIQDNQCVGLLLDFQIPEEPELAILVKQLTTALPCPIGVTKAYGKDCDCAVFLPPLSPSDGLEDMLSHWSGREIWLELALDGEVITLTEQGAEVTALPFPDLEAPGFADDSLHCHYKIELRNDQPVFTLWRTREDMHDLLEEANAQGITTAVGLYQEFSLYN